MSMMHGLVAGKGKLDLKKIVMFYAKWIKSKPFDIGATTRNSLFKADVNNPNPAYLYKASLSKMSKTSLSNGALMRITPLAVFIH
jgi:ADP-ribosylglycohydrolase